MESESQSMKIEETVIAILKDADLEEATEYKVRTTAAERIGLDLSDLAHKCLVRRVVESYLLSLEEEEEEEEEEEDKPDKADEQETKLGASDGGGRVICKLAEKRALAVHDFRGKTFVSIRDFYHKDGKLLPSARGISLNTEQWSAFRKSVPIVEAAITKMESRIRSEDAGKQTKADMSYSETAGPQGFVSTEAKQIETDISNPFFFSFPQKLVPVEAKQIELDVSNSPSNSAPHGLMPTETEQTEADITSSMEIKQTETDISKQTEPDISNSVSASAAQKLVPIERKQPEAGISSFVCASSPRGLVHIQTTRLDGKNYYSWVHQMEHFLKQLKIAYVLSEPCPSIDKHPEASFEENAKAKAAMQKWVDDDFICRQSILNSLSDPLFDQHSKKTESAKELWDELKLAYDEDFGTKRSQVNKYIRFQMVDGVPILEQVQLLHNIADSIIASGMWVDEDFHVSAIISKLPPSWKEYRMRLMHEEFIPLKVLMYRLRIEEESRNHVQKKDVSKNAHVGRIENELGPKKGDFKRHGETERNKRIVICFNCGKNGHISKNCQQRKAYVWEKKNDKIELVPVVEEATTVEGIVEN